MSEQPGRWGLFTRRSRVGGPPLIRHLLPYPAFRFLKQVKGEVRLRVVKAVRSGLVQPVLIVGEPTDEPLPSVALIPMIHPGHPSVTDYAGLERHLERTLTSIGAQRPAPVRSVVVGQAAPPFADRFGGALTFVDVSASDELRPGQLRYGGENQYVDKAIKYLIGQTVADVWFGPEVLLTVDADDLLVCEVATVVSACLRRLPETGGVTWTRGFELALDGDGRFTRAIEVEQFHKLCGTSRAIRTATFVNGAAAEAREHFAEALANVRQMVPAAWDGGVITLDDAAAASLDACVRAMPRAFFERLALWGDHIQDPFRTTRIAYVGAAKVCGHGQHISGQDALDRFRQVAEVDVAEALALVGL